jgi:HD-GYP domain-containing protein (c-di-GMP phosphodiesterase class II)
MQKLHVARASDVVERRTAALDVPVRHSIATLVDQRSRGRVAPAGEPIGSPAANKMTMDLAAGGGAHQQTAAPVAVTRTLPYLQALARALDAVQEDTALHSERVARLAFAVALDLGWPRDRAQLLAQAALVHDVGKVTIPDGVLTKPGPLTAEEFELVMGHPEAGARMVEGALTAEQTSWILHHHERVDGCGYPDHAAASEIPEGSRILGLVDAFDVMTAGRPYQAPVPLAAAIAECTQLAGHQFDRRVVRSLTRLLRPLPEDPLPPLVSRPSSAGSSVPA